ncbi:MAG TPA: ABC transporter permease [Gemmataceae bacterium]|jgi:putative ABC transport system permease protein|nr:ABC transporter permease [Gemmataceae bacterium]
MPPWKHATLWKFTVRQMRRRPGRTLLTLLGIVIGVATVVAISVTVRTTNTASRTMFETLTGRASLEVVAEGLGDFEEGLAGGLASCSGVAAAVPVIQAPALLLGPSGSAPVVALGVDPAREGAARDAALAEGRPLAGPEDVLLEAGFARAHGLPLGGAARLLTPRGLHQLRVVGLLQRRGAAVFNGGAVAVMSLETAQRVFGLRGKVNSVQIVLADGAGLQQVESDIARRLPAGLRVQTPGTRGELAQEILFSWEQTMRTMSFVSLVAGAFVILNTFHMNLGERRRQLAVLRALGATRNQVARLLLREALLLGLAGTLIGIPAGLGLAIVCTRAMGQLMGVALPELHLTSEPFLLALVLGPGVALVATYVPVRRAVRQPILEGLLSQPGGQATAVGRRSCYLGLAVVAASVALMVAGINGWVGRPVLAASAPAVMAAFLAGSVLAVPLVLGPLLLVVARVLRPWWGMEGRLAFRQLDRHRARTGLTVGALVVAIVIAIGIGQALLNGIRRYDEYYRRASVADFLVQGSMPGLSMVGLAPLPESLGTEIGGLAGIERVDKLSFLVARASGQQVLVLARTFAPDRPLPLDPAAGDAEAMRRGLSRGEVVLGTGLAQRAGVGVGERITLETRRGPVRLRVAGTTNEWTAYGLCLYMEWGAAKRLLRADGVHAFQVTARQGAAPEVGEGLRRLCRQRGLQVLSFA